MPNHVSNQIEFACNPKLGKQIITEVTKDGSVDFNLLIPMPLSIYCGGLSKTDDEDFGENTWLVWCRKYWGTKWNAYSGKIIKNEAGDEIKLYFETAWSLPYPFIIAFANKYKLDFVYKYFDEGHNFWGDEEWKAGERVERNRNPEETQKALHIELRGYDYTNEDEEE